MDSIDEELQDQQNKEGQILSNSVKVVNVIISSNQNIVSIHTSTSKYFIDSNNEEIKDDEPLRNNNFESLLIDISKQTRNLNQDKIKELWIKELMPNLERNEDLYSISNQKQEEVSKEESMIISDQEDKPGLDQRKRNEKLTTTQRELLKSIIKKKQNTIKKISAKYNISRSVLNKIVSLNRMKLPVRAAKEYIKLNYRQKKELLSKIKKLLKDDWTYIFCCKCHKICK